MILVLKANKKLSIVKEKGEITSMSPVTIHSVRQTQKEAIIDMRQGNYNNIMSYFWTIPYYINS